MVLQYLPSSKAQRHDAVEYMATWRTLGAIALIALGTLVAAAGPAALSDTAQAAVRHLDIVLLALAVVVLLSVAAPKGTLKAPVAIAIAGLAILAAKHGLLTSRNLRITAGIGLAVIGSWLILAHSARVRDWTEPVQRLTVVLFGRPLSAPEGSVAPRHLTVTAVGAVAKVDLRHSRWPDPAPAVEVAINCVAGRVEVFVPADWTVAAGRVHLSWGIDFAGDLDLRAPVPHMEDLAGEAAAHLRRVVIVHVVGLAGIVTVPNRGKAHRAATGQSSPPGSSERLSDTSGSDVIASSPPTLPLGSDGPTR